MTLAWHGWSTAGARTEGNGCGEFDGEIGVLATFGLLGAVLGHLGPVLGHLWLVLGHLGSYLGAGLAYLEVVLRHLGGSCGTSWTIKAKHQKMTPPRKAVPEPGPWLLEPFSTLKLAYKPTQKHIFLR